MASYVLLLLSYLLVSSASACDRCVHKSKTSYFSSPSSLAGGACGYGTTVTELYGGRYPVAAAASSLYRGGVGCGGCFQIRCKNRKFCTGAGVKVVVTNLNKSNQTDLVLSLPAFLGMAKDGMGRTLKRLGDVDVEYRRVPCEYSSHHNLSFRVEESSRRPAHLVVKLLYQGGQTDIVAVDVARVGSSDWQYMTRDFGAIWSTGRAPTGALQFRLVVTGGYDGKWVWAEEVLPADWRTGAVYDAGVQINDIAQESCFPCDSEVWK
ncbi:unnamed protein product [Spirodela intermedia]|uniref:Uncharacterized protein n=1 Tax=Spirodela intermedia TaxID=51605 RepID=A0A7I8IE63_SPIIN|nr:unnamed protein product [Spirodela intermedia]CAA6656076.1 unnamed protein product [Spirodela intermedia]